MKSKLLFLFNAIKEFDYNPQFIISNLVALGTIFFIVFNAVMLNTSTTTTIITGFVFVSFFLGYNLTQIVIEYNSFLSYNNKSNSANSTIPSSKTYQTIPNIENVLDETPIIDETPDGKYVIINGKKYIKSMMKDSIIQGILNKSLKENNSANLKNFTY